MPVTIEAHVATIETNEGAAAPRFGYVVAVERASCFIVFVLALAYLSLFRHVGTMEPDEGILLQGAQRILEGQVPYRDFFSFYTPGSYYLLALLFRVLGSSVVIARLWLASAGAILSMITYLLARRVSSFSIAWVAAGLTTLSTLPYRFLVLHNWDSTLWACLAIYSAVRVLERAGRAWPFALGLFSALTVLFEQSKGAGLCLGLGAGFVAIFFLTRREALVRWRQMIAIACGFALPLAIVLTYFASQNAFASMTADLIWPLQHYSTANCVPYAYQNWSDDTRYLLFATGSAAERAIKLLAISPCLWIPVLPLVATGLLGYWIMRAKRHGLDETARHYILVCASLVGLLLSVVAVRADIIHIMYLQPLNCLVLVWCLSGRELPVRILKIARPILAAYAVAALLAFGMPPLFGALSAHNEVRSRRGLIRTVKPDTVIHYVQARVAPGASIFVYPYLPMYYFATATASPSQYDYFQPGMNTEEQANQIIGQLTSQHTAVVLFEIGFPEKIPHSWPGTPVNAIVNDPIADYIVHNYRTCAPLVSPAGWRFLFMVRKDLTCR